MKIFEFFYIIGIFLIIISIAAYSLSTTVIPNPGDHSVSSILGKKTEIDTVITSDEAIADVGEMQRQKNTIILWVGIPLGIVIFLAGIITKRKTIGTDLFIDNDLEDDE